MAVCNEGTGPDADALVGLAQVAWGMGEREDAIVFAREAATLDPTHPARRRTGRADGGGGPRLKFRLNRPMTGGTNGSGSTPGHGRPQEPA